MRPQSSMIDVREMLCAQALALVAQALGRVEIGSLLGVRYGSDDVRQDLVVWARDRGHGVLETGERTLQLTRRR